MIVGNPSLLAIQSELTIAFARTSFLGLGYFALHVGNLCYGVRTPDATMLACSFEAVTKRIKERGRHQVSFATMSEAGQIADAVRLALYAESEADSRYLGLEQQEFSDSIYENDLLWAPDGDEAFDDGSYVLQFDIGEHVRVIAFKCVEGFLHDPKTLRDVWLSANDYYEVLLQWRDVFHAAWVAAPKVPSSDEAS
jgi:hypothetical protein